MIAKFFKYYCKLDITAVAQRFWFLSNNNAYSLGLIYSGFILVKTKNKTSWQERWFLRRRIWDTLGWESSDAVIPLIYDGFLPSTSGNIASSIILYSYFISACIVILCNWQTFFSFNKPTWLERQLFLYYCTHFTISFTIFTIYVLFPIGEFLSWRVSRVLIYKERLNFNNHAIFWTATYCLSQAWVDSIIWWRINAVRWRLFVEDPMLTPRNPIRVKIGYVLNTSTFWINIIALLSTSIFLLQGWDMRSVQMERFQDTLIGKLFFKITNAPKTKEEAVRQAAARAVKRRLLVEKLLKGKPKKKTPEYYKLLAKIRKTQLTNKKETGTALYNKEQLRVMLAKQLYIKQKRSAESLKKNKKKYSRDQQMAEAWEKKTLFGQDTSWSSLLPDVSEIRFFTTIAIKPYWPKTFMRIIWRCVDLVYFYRDKCLDYFWPPQARKKLRFHVSVAHKRFKRNFYNWLYSSKNPVVLTIYQCFKYIKKTTKRFIKKIKYLTIKTTYYYCIKPLWHYLFKPITDFFVKPLFLITKTLYEHTIKLLYVEIIKPWYTNIFRNKRKFYKMVGGSYLADYIDSRPPVTKKEWEKLWRKRWNKQAEKSVRKHHAEKDYGTFINKFGVFKRLVDNRITKFVWLSNREMTEEALKKQKADAKRRKAMLEKARIAEMKRQLKARYKPGFKSKAKIEREWANYEARLIRKGMNAAITAEKKAAKKKSKSKRRSHNKNQSKKKQ